VTRRLSCFEIERGFHLTAKDIPNHRKVKPKAHGGTRDHRSQSARIELSRRRWKVSAREDRPTLDAPQNRRHDDDLSRRRFVSRTTSPVVLRRVNNNCFQSDDELNLKILSGVK
jgi:hypothetical protein